MSPYLILTFYYSSSAETDNFPKPHRPFIFTALEAVCIQLAMWRCSTAPPVVQVQPSMRYPSSMSRYKTRAEASDVLSWGALHIADCCQEAFEQLGHVTT